MWNSGQTLDKNNTKIQLLTFWLSQSSTFPNKKKKKKKKLRLEIIEKSSDEKTTGILDEK